MKSLKSLCSIVLLMATISSYAQDEVIIIDRNNYRQPRKERQLKLNDNIQVFKFSPLKMLIGEINFGYERQIGQKGSIDLEVGPTISQIGIGIESHLVDPFNPSAVQSGALGLVLGAGVRYYPLDETEALNRFYVSPVLKYKLMNTLYEDASGIITDTRKGSKSMMNFYFNFGYQVWLSKSFSLDFYAGFGIGMHTETTYFTTSEFVNNEWIYGWEEDIASGAVYVGNIGVKVGIGAK